MAEPQHLLCWTVCAYRKPGLSEEEYHKYISEVHGPLVKGLAEKYGLVRLSMVLCHSYPLSTPVISNRRDNSRITQPAPVP